MPSQSYTSIYQLCYRASKLTKCQLVKELKKIVTANPGVVNETDDHGRTLLHCAAAFRCVEFCSFLAEKNPKATETCDNDGWLPLHHCCLHHNVEVAKYIIGLYPKGISSPNYDGDYPIHLVFEYEYEDNDDDYDINENIFILITLMMQHDRGIMSEPGNNGNFPLHHACIRPETNLSTLVPIFNAYPEAIYYKNDYNLSPLQEAWDTDNEEVASFFSTQIKLIRQAEVDMVPDYYGDLPIHRALRNNVAEYGTIQIMRDANPDSLSVANIMEMRPLHIACLSGNLEIVKCLVDANEDSLRHHDMKKNYPLHIACIAGKHDVINYILGKSDHGVSLRNADGNLPIELLLFHATCNRDSMEYMDAVGSLLRAYPLVVSFLEVKSNDTCKKRKQIEV